VTSYTASQYEDNYPAGFEDYFWIAARNAVIHDMIVSAGMAHLRLMEVGCGRGIVVDFLRQRGVDCLGCELAEAPVPPALAPYVRTGTDAALLEEPLRRSIDGLLLLDVIEHVDDAPAFIVRLSDAFPHAEVLLVTVPAHPELWSNWDDHYGHFRRYTKAALVPCITAAGFLPQRVTSFFLSLYAPMRLMSLLRRQRGTQQAAPKNRALHAAIAGFFRWEARLLPDTGLGTSLAVIAVKRRQG